MQHKPFLKFAGGKFKLAEKIIAQLDPSKHTYVEPFLGSGAVFLNTNYSEYLLADINPDLINLYTILKEQGAKFMKDCSDLFIAQNNNAEKYYEFREKFNSSTDPYVRSVLFVYLNRHCFNGLCRYNQDGKFNVPFGKYTTVYFPEKEMSFFYKKSQNATFICSDFRKTLFRLNKNSAVYCDPPYLPLTVTSNFTKYAVKDFTFSDHKALASLLKRMSNRGLSCVVSNHDVPAARKLYKTFNFIEIPVYRSISASADNRIQAKEILMTGRGKVIRPVPSTTV